jgi:phage terminase Nu1 subunit (DNA packaging protein)
VPRRVIGGRIAGRPEICQIFGVTKYEVDKWIQAGCPVAERPADRNGEWKFDTADLAVILRG